MNYVDQNLIPGETVIYRGQLHWVIFLRPVVYMLFGLVFVGLGMGSLVGFMLLVSLLSAINAAINYMTSAFAVTNKRVMMKYGFIRRTSLELLLSKVEGIVVDQGILGRLLGYGTIVVTGTGGSKTPCHNIASPLEFRKQVQSQLATS